MSEVYKGQVIPLYSDPADGPGSFRDLVDSGPIPRFNTAAERDASIPTPVVGQVVYRADAKAGGAMEIYSAGAWKDTVAGLAPTAHSHKGTDISQAGDIPIAQLPSIPASQITTGTLAAARLPAATATVAGVVRLDQLDTNHNHNQMYYTEAEVNGLLGVRVPFYPAPAGITGEIRGKWIFTGDPVYFKSLEVDGIVYARDFVRISTAQAKADIRPVALGGTAFERLSPVSFRYKDEARVRMGFIYEEMKEIAPEWAIKKGISYESMLPDFMAWAITAIRELRSQLSSQEEDE